MAANTADVEFLEVIAAMLGESADFGDTPALQ